MEDSAIIDLYWAREERALLETQRKYGPYCWAIAHNILRSREDADEALNDTLLKAWDAMPPQRPRVLSAFLGRVTRNLSLDRYKHTRAAKRGGGQILLALDELSQCLPSPMSVEDAVLQGDLSRTIDRFLRTLPEKDRCVFMRRYFYIDTTLDIAHRYHMAEGTVKSSLHRTRQKLRAYLQQEGVTP